MGRLDVLKSLVRSTAKQAIERLGDLGISTELTDLIQQAALRRMVLDEARLTAAVGRVPGIEGATVSVGPDGIAIQVSDDRGRELSATLRPVSTSFAPRGAKEITFEVLPPEAAAQNHCSDVFGAIATEVALTLWATVLPRTVSAHQVFVHRTGNRLSADLRTVPGLRQALSNPVAVALVDTLRVKRFELSPGRLHMHLGVEGLH